jgi:hypothetical protein
MPTAAPHVGTLREKPLHASLKRWCARAGDLVEVPVDGFVIDLVRDDVLVEVQTSGFSSMKRKLVTLLDLGHRVRIVHPVPVDKWIVRVAGDGAELGRRRSPKHGAAVDIFAEHVIESFAKIASGAEPTAPDPPGGPAHDATPPSKGTT